MKSTLQQAIEVLRHLPEEKAEIAAAVIINFAADQRRDVEPEVIWF